MTFDEVSEYMRVPEGTLRRWRATGQGPKSFTVGRRVLFKESDVDSWIEQQYTLAGESHAAA